MIWSMGDMHGSVHIDKELSAYRYQSTLTFMFIQRASVGQREILDENHASKQLDLFNQHVWAE